MSTPPASSPKDFRPVGNGGGSGNGGGGGGGNPADPGSPAILIEFLPASLLPVANADKLASFVDNVQAVLAPLAVKLQSVTGLMLAGPSAVAGENPPDQTPIVRAGLWALPSTFPFAAQDPDHPHQLPVLTAASEASGFGQAAPLGVPETASVAGAPGSPTAGFAFAVPVATLNMLAAAALAKIQAAAPAGVSVSSVTVTCAPSAAGGTVTTAVEASAGGDGISGTITETLGLQDGAVPGTKVPEVQGTFSAGTDVGTQVLLGAALILSGAGLDAGVAMLITALGITLAVPPWLGGKVGPQLAMISALVNMLPPALPFEPPQPIALIPDFPELVFEWSTFAATASGIIGRAAVTVAARPLGSGTVTVSGPADLECLQGEGGAYGEFTVTWADIAPTSFGWQVDGANATASGPITTRVFPFEQGFTAHFPVQDITPGAYFFTLTVDAAEANINNQAQTLTASASQQVIVHVRENPGPGGWQP